MVVRRSWEAGGRGKERVNLSDIGHHGLLVWNLAALRRGAGGFRTLARDRRTLKRSSCVWVAQYDCMDFARILQLLPRHWQAACSARGRKYSVDGMGQAARKMQQVACRKSARTRPAVRRTAEQAADDSRKSAKPPFRIPSCDWSYEN